MRIIYDEKLAADKVLQREKYEKKLERILGIWLFLAVTCMIGAAVSWCFIKETGGLPGIIFSLGILVSGVGCASALPRILFPDPLPPDVVYFLESQKGNVLKVEMDHHSDESIVYLYTENKDGIVNKTKLCRAVFKASTKHPKKTFDVNQGVIFTPFTQN